MDRIRAGGRPWSVATTVVGAQLAAVTVCLSLLSAGLPVPAVLVAAFALGGAMFVPMGGRLPLSWLAAGLRFVRADRAPSGHGEDFRSPGETVGLYWVGGQALAVVELSPPRHSWALVTRDSYAAPERVPLSILAGCLEQNDVTLSGIDIVSHGSRAVEGTPAAAVYDELTGPLPATAQRIVWVVLRFEPTANPASVARRGGGSDGASRTLAVAARRVVRALTDSGIGARILTAAEVDSACARVCRGVHPTAMGDRWDHVPLAGLYNVGNSIDPNRLSTALLTAVWSAPSVGTTVSLRLRPGPGTVLVGAAFRRTTRDRPDRLPAAGLISAQGVHRASLLAHLPVSSPQLDGLIPLVEFTPERLDELSLPVTGCGQLIGSDAHGRAVTARLTGPGVTAVHVAGELHLLRQIVFRAVATGARVVVHTDRPQAWAGLIDAVGTPGRLRTGAENSWSEAGFDTVVVDGVPAPAERAGVTAIHVAADARMWPRSEPDVAIVQPGAFGDRVVMTVGTHRIELTVVTIASETAFTGRSDAPAPVAAAR